MEDSEPERYYDWMLWKMRQEREVSDSVNSYPDGYSTEWREHEMKNYDQLDSEILKQLIYVTSEECGELVQASMKIARWGIDKKKHTNLLEEAGDVRCMLDLMIENGLFTEEELKDQAKVKRNKLKRYTPIIVKE